MGKTIKQIALISAVGLLAACQSSGLTSKLTPASSDGQDTQQTTEANLVEAGSRACAVRIAGGPPPKPDKTVDFGEGVATGVGRGAQRSAITHAGSRIGGQFGAIVGSSIARSQVRDVQDLHGSWTITDGSPDCGCKIEIKTGFSLSGKSSKSGKLTSQGCRGALLVQAARWNLGHTFTGYGAAFNLFRSDGRTSVANMKRDGINYFSGTMADGTPVTMWR